MSHQPQDLGYLDYPTPPSRSPNSSRQNYAGAFAGGMSLPRQPQRPFDMPLGSSALYPSDRMGGGYHARPMEGAPGGAGMPPGYMVDNSQAWNYNGAGAATVNGAVNGPNRRNMRGRNAIPQNWADQGGMGMPPNNGLQGFPGSMNSGHMLNGLRVDHGAHTSPDLRSTASDSEQLIPTAIVIKNIPFAVRKETLASIMVDLQLPQPYAFNYHFDNGVFRGLAFANFQSAEDTRHVIEVMNGMDVQGRKLRVEYKKMLPEAERERIEREKRERRGQLEEQHRGPMLHQQSSIQSLGSMSQTQQRAPSASLLRDVDLNDPDTLEYYTELIMFRRDETREVLVFPPTVTPELRRNIHILAHHMGLEHQSIGEADSRQVTVLKQQQPSPTTNVQNLSVNPMDAHKQRGLSRAATFDFAGDREARATSSNHSHVVGRQGPTLELPGSPDGAGVPNNLRAAKSFADLRSFTPSPSQASSGYLGPNSAMSGMPPGAGARYGEYMGAVGQPGPGGAGGPGSKADGGIVSGLGGLSLSPYDGAMQAQARSTPGAIGSQRPGAGAGKNAPERQPRGPEWEPSAGFGRRANGHMTRGSDSSDNGAHVGNSSGATRYH